MAKNTQTIRIESILGGESSAPGFAGGGEYKKAFGINPLLPIVDDFDDDDLYPSGYLRPVPTTTISNAIASTASITLAAKNGKSPAVYMYASTGSVFSMSTNHTPDAPTPRADGGSMSGSNGNGLAYYDNYMYFSKDTTIARYGPLNGSPSFNGDYWVGTLGKAELDQTNIIGTGPHIGAANFPNHLLHRHTDGRLYIADAVDGGGILSYISTTKTTVEGDTDNNSTYDKVRLPTGFFISAIASYGEQIVTGLFESGGSGRMNARLCFWDTVSQNINFITNNEFVDKFIIKIINLNGVLYIVSSDAWSYNSYPKAFRVTRYLGGNSFEELRWFTGLPPLPGAVTVADNKLLFATVNGLDPTNATFYHNVIIYNPVDNSFFSSGCTESGKYITTLIEAVNSRNGTNILANWVDYAADEVGLDVISPSDLSGVTPNYSSLNQKWSSLVFKIGQPFKITKIRFPLAQKLAASMSVMPTLYFDDGVETKTLTTIDSTNYGTNTRTVTQRPENATGDNNFWLDLVWTGSVRCTLALPITIEYELLDVDSQHP